MAKSHEKLQALKMRRKGASIKSIARTLGVSTGSVSLWCQSIELTDAQKAKLNLAQIKAGHRGRMLGAEYNKQKRLASINEANQWGKGKIKKMSLRDLFLLGIGLYWGEGAKSRTDPAAVTNADPAVVLFAMRWMRECLGVKKEDFRPYIYISATHKLREKAILRFWSKLLALPPRQFHKIIFLQGRPKKVYENHNSYYGVCALRVRNGTNLKYRILGLIGACKEYVGVAQVVRAWHS